MPRRVIFDDSHELFRASVRKFFAAELTPNIPRWKANRMMDKSFWRQCGEQGLLCPDMPEEYGGGGQDFRCNAIVLEETSFTGSSPPTFGVHSDNEYEISRLWEDARVQRICGGTSEILKELISRAI